MAKRGKNFNEFERNIIVELVGEKRQIVENKRTDAVFLKEKMAAWEEITARYNALSQTGTRTSKQLHALYDFLKKKARSDQHDDRVELYKTGGGSFKNKLDSTGEKIISMLAPQFKPLVNVYDSSSNFYGEGSTEITVENSQESEHPNLEMNRPEVIEHSMQQEINCQNEHHSTPLPTKIVHTSPRKKNSRNKKKCSTTSATSLQQISNSIKKRKLAKNSLEKEIHVKKCKLLDTEQEIKEEILRRTSSIMEKEEKLKDLEIQIKEYELRCRVIELDKKKFELNSMKQNQQEYVQYEEF